MSGHSVSPCCFPLCAPESWVLMAAVCLEHWGLQSVLSTDGCSLSWPQVSASFMSPGRHLFYLYGGVKSTLMSNAFHLNLEYGGFFRPFWGCAAHTPKFHCGRMSHYVLFIFDFRWVSLFCCLIWEIICILLELLWGVQNAFSAAMCFWVFCAYVLLILGRWLPELVLVWWSSRLCNPRVVTNELS